ncbi:protein FAR1-RELATED SEQUENCE 5-like [Arachis duranensis]|uniref:Protein FAR1-RELATED SEQUENCE 5-like n=1 Tax=Arachis duranensis TaxID=130453 RepID=A0A6P4CS80_ARADU|nr:protein FAR1-RELATED SEQUENCE 5-like [Arachis duranensis]
MDKCEYEHEDSIFYNEKYSGDESYLDDLQQEEKFGDELDDKEIFEELTDYDYDDVYGLDSIEDLLKLDFLSIGEVEVDKFHFGTLPIAFEFYNKFTKSQDFSARKDKNWKNSNDETYIHICYCQVTGSISKAEIALMNNMRKSKISTSQVYALLASQNGGFDKLNYGPRDMYNQIAKMRCEIAENVGRALNYLEEMAVKDKSLYYEKLRATDGRLLNLFWCDGLCREDYELFENVAFDATYNKNKYKCHFVVFTCVNHHNQTVVFAACIVTDETDETYIWVLQQFLEAMNGKAPSSVITDGQGQ